MIADLKFRKLRAEDAFKIARLIKRCLREVNSKDYPPDIISNLEANFSPSRIIERRSRQDIYIVMHGSRIVGTGALEKNRVLAVFVAPHLHGRGIGRKVMSRLEAVAVRRGFSRITLAASLTSRQFYKQLGYRRVRERFDSVGGRVVEMIKVLKNRGGSR